MYEASMYVFHWDDEEEPCSAFSMTSTGVITIGYSDGLDSIDRLLVLHQSLTCDYAIRLVFRQGISRYVPGYMRWRFCALFNEYA